MHLPAPRAIYRFVLQSVRRRDRGGNHRPSEDAEEGEEELDDRGGEDQEAPGEEET